MFIDSHCHLNMLQLEEYNNELSRLINEAHHLGIEHILCVATNLENSHSVIQISEKYESISSSVGVHPSDAQSVKLSVSDLCKLGQHPKVRAIGETGLDYHYNYQDLDNMRETFRIHIRAARELNKPLIIHSRDASEDTITILKEEGAKSVMGVMHCFTESWEVAQAAMELGFYISISGIVTFKNAPEVVEIAKKIPKDRLLIETDAPFLAPVPYRGKENKPQYLLFVAQKIAELRAISLESLAELTTANFYRLFGS